jgi:hypothetical protein
VDKQAEPTPNSLIKFNKEFGERHKQLYIKSAKVCDPLNIGIDRQTSRAYIIIV